jgi:phosphatidylinositol 4-kinase A
MVVQLASLLLPIDALLSHSLFDAKTIAELAPEVIALFRNMWFLCILFHFTSPELKEGSVMEWQKPALLRIALKTPDFVLEDARDSLFGDIEFNPVIRHEFAQSVGYLYLLTDLYN